jgi:hypothetical protein
MLCSNKTQANGKYLILNGKNVAFTCKIVLASVLTNQKEIQFLIDNKKKLWVNPKANYLCLTQKQILF